MSQFHVNLQDIFPNRHHVEYVVHAQLLPVYVPVSAVVGGVKASSNGGGVDSSAEDRKKGKRGRNKKRPKDDRPAHAETLCAHLSVGRECHFGSRYTKMISLGYFPADWDVLGHRGQYCPLSLDIFKTIVDLLPLIRASKRSRLHVYIFCRVDAG